ncbi:hypothetical protein CH379_014025 [Leptospira ellisii]|uniref:Uncharacterized protein n=1 Tax=Leptospira ellisii TaxID=2023197 RepID=A0AAE4QPA6_9LEPT|nr:hypothetical protein [Leptospira ellisii]MDV6236742.1 hypothetical protein [Leptospira ellisii]
MEMVLLRGIGSRSELGERTGGKKGTEEILRLLYNKKIVGSPSTER